LDLIVSQIATLESVTGGYGTTFVLAGLLTYLVTSYFSYIRQKTVWRVNAVRPDIERIKNHFQGNSTALKRALADLYASRGINVSGFIAGLVPLIVMAVRVLILSVAIVPESSGIHSVLLPWIRDLSDPDPWYVLPFAVGLVYWTQRYLTLRFNPPTSSTPKRYIAMGIPVFALLASAVLPAGVALYWLTYATLSVTQQYVVFQYVLAAFTT
jgi:YidC/Oxa1 family membrane protein insertase